MSETNSNSSPRKKPNLNAAPLSTNASNAAPPSADTSSAAPHSANTSNATPLSSNIHSNNASEQQPAVPFSNLLQNLSGTIEYTLQNDVVFHLAMERSPMISLRGLISDLLSIPFNDITDVQVLNPIMQTGPKGKKIILDVLAEINHSRRVNIELQTWKDEEWVNRSIYYLCREFTNINAGEHYNDIKPATHISIMSYTLFPEAPEFYAKYRLLNIKNNLIYTPHFALNVLDLSKDYLATESDRRNHLDYWAKLFKCKTWEEVRALAAQSPVYKEVAESMAISNTNLEEYNWARQHDRYVSGMRGSYTAGWNARQEEIDELSRKFDEERETFNKKLGEEREAFNKKLDEERSASSEKIAAFETRIKELEALIAATKTD